MKPTSRETEEGRGRCLLAVSGGLARNAGASAGGTHPSAPTRLLLRLSPRTDPSRVSCRRVPGWWKQGHRRNRPVPRCGGRLDGRRRQFTPNCAPAGRVRPSSTISWSRLRLRLQMPRGGGQMIDDAAVDSVAGAIFQFRNPSVRQAWSAQCRGCRQPSARRTRPHRTNAAPLPPVTVLEFPPALAGAGCLIGQFGTETGGRRARRMGLGDAEHAADRRRSMRSRSPPARRVLDEVTSGILP